MTSIDRWQSVAISILSVCLVGYGVILYRFLDIVKDLLKDLFDSLGGISSAAMAMGGKKVPSEGEMKKLIRETWEVAKNEKD